MTDLERFREVLGTSLRHSLGAECPQPQAVLSETTDTSQHNDLTIERLCIGRRGKGDRVPALLFRRAGAKPPLSAALVVHPDGKAALLGADGKSAGETATKALERVDLVLTLDCLLTGESQAAPSRAEAMKDMKYFTTYNRTDLANRVQDILTGLAFLRDLPDVERVCLVGLQKAGLWCLLARALAPFVNATAADGDQFDATNDDSFIAQLAAPSIRRAGDLRTAGGLAAPGKLFIHNAGNKFPIDWVRDVYRAADAEDKLRVRRVKASEETVFSSLSE